MDEKEMLLALKKHLIWAQEKVEHELTKSQHFYQGLHYLDFEIKICTNLMSHLMAAGKKRSYGKKKKS